MGMTPACITAQHQAAAGRLTAAYYMGFMIFIIIFPFFIL